MGCYNACPRGTMTNLTGVIRQLRKEKQRVHGEMERLNAALAALGSVGGLERKSKGSRTPKVRRPCQRPLARKSRRPSVHAGQNGRKTSEPSEGHRDLCACFQCFTPI